jgi:hypothetical protein
LLTLKLLERPLQRLGLLLHRRPLVALEQGLEAPLAEGAAARTADLIDEAIGGEIEGVLGIQRKG